MGQKRYTPEQIIGKLRQAEVRSAEGARVAEIVRELGITEQTYYRWRREYGGLKVAQAKRLKELEKVNAACQTEPGVQDLQRWSCTPADRTAQTMLP
jgi:putative transposase